MILKIKFKIIEFFLKVGSYLFGYQVPPIPSVSAIILKENKLLVVKLSYQDGYALPGGVIKGNENYEEAITREVKEETGLNVTALEYFGTYCVVDPYSKINVTYKARVSGKLRSSKEGMPEWKTPEEIINHFVYRDNIEAIKQYLKK